MHKNFSLSFKKWDILTIAVSILLAVGLIVGILVFRSLNPATARYVNIYYNNQLVNRDTIDLNALKEEETFILTTDKNKTSDEATIIYVKEMQNGLKGDFVIKVNPEKGIKVSEAICKTHECINQGWVNTDGLPIICVQNFVRVEIEASNPLDIIV